MARLEGPSLLSQQLSILDYEDGYEDEQLEAEKRRIERCNLNPLDLSAVESSASAFRSSSQMSSINRHS